MIDTGTMADRECCANLCSNQRRHSAAMLGYLAFLPPPAPATFLRRRQLAKLLEMQQALRSEPSRLEDGQHGAVPRDGEHALHCDICEGWMAECRDSGSRIRVPRKMLSPPLGHSMHQSTCIVRSGISLQPG